MVTRTAFYKLQRRLIEPRRFIQVLAGPRQTGKTTIARQLVESLGVPSHYASADEPALKDSTWIAQQWEIARLRNNAPSVLILDEVQKLTAWSETVKRLWDEDTAAAVDVRVVLLGSSPLLVQRGLAESLTGRFEVIPVTHWSYPEMRDAFGWSLEQYVYHGGYPGAAPLIEEPDRWARYVLDSLIETSVSRDVLLMSRVDKPALLRRLFDLGCSYSGRILSYQKMLGQLQDAGNTTTLAHYLELLGNAGLLIGLQKYSGQNVRRRASSPKFVAMNSALVTAMRGVPFNDARRDPAYWGQLVESAVGATLANGIIGQDIELHYWAANNKEVDYVLRRGKKLVAIEVKSGRRRDGLPGIQQFCREFPKARPLLVGADGIPLVEFFEAPVEHWLS